jgi:hypothetical protein
MGLFGCKLAGAMAVEIFSESWKRLKKFGVEREACGQGTNLSVAPVTQP